MNRLTRMLVTMASVAAFCAGAMSCNTVHGAGKDIQKGGEAVQKASDEVKKDM